MPQTLPTEIWERILKCLDDRSAKSCKAACVRFAALVRAPEFRKISLRCKWYSSRWSTPLGSGIYKPTISSFERLLRDSPAVASFVRYMTIGDDNICPRGLDAMLSAFGNGNLVSFSIHQHRRPQLPWPTLLIHNSVLSNVKHLYLAGITDFPASVLGSLPTLLKLDFRSVSCVEEGKDVWLPVIQSAAIDSSNTIILKCLARHSLNITHLKVRWALQCNRAATADSVAQILRQARKLRSLTFEYDADVFENKHISAIMDAVVAGLCGCCVHLPDHLLLESRFLGPVLDEHLDAVLKVLPLLGTYLTDVVFRGNFGEEKSQAILGKVMAVMFPKFEQSLKSVRVDVLKETWPGVQHLSHSYLASAGCGEATVPMHEDDTEFYWFIDDSVVATWGKSVQKIGTW